MDGLRSVDVDTVETILYYAGRLGRREFHSVAYLLSYAGVWRQFRFRLGNYGPYSAELDAAIDDAFYLGTVSISSVIDGSSIRPFLGIGRHWTEDMVGSKYPCDSEFRNIVRIARDFGETSRLRLATTAAFLSKTVDEVDEANRWNQMIALVERTRMGWEFREYGDRRFAVALRQAFESYEQLRALLGNRLPKAIQYYEGML